jgi:organic hydroperoxide reductase OsmC/OhrA
MAAQIKHKSYRYKARTSWTGERHGAMSAAGRPDIPVGSPPEFRGDGKSWAPEELLLGSVNTCILLTFLSLIQGCGVTLVAYDSEVEGLLEHKEGAHQMTQVTVRPHVTVASEAEIATAREIMDEVEPRCFMSQSIKARVSVEAQFAAGAPAKA